MRTTCMLGLIACSLSILGCHTSPAPPNQPAQAADTAMLGHSAWPALEPMRYPEPDPDARAANKATYEQMQTRIDFEFDDVTFGQLIDYLRDTTGANIVVNWPELDRMGITEDQTIKLQVKQVTAEILLGMTLMMIGTEQFDDEKPTFRIQDGVVLISTIYDLRTITEVRVYDVRGLVYLRPTLVQFLYSDHETAKPFVELLKQGDILLEYPNFDLSLSSDALDGFDSRDSNTDGGGAVIQSPGGLFGKDDVKEEDTRTELLIERDRRIDQLFSFIYDTVGSQDEWLDEESTIQEINGNLIIKTTPTNHEQVAMLLATLQQSQIKHFQRQARLVEVLILLKRAEEHRLNQDYRSALRYLQQAQRVDPHNPEAAALRELVEEIMRR